MDTSHATHPELLAKFIRWREQNHAGGWPVRWRRRAIWPSLIAQKLGLELKVDAPLFWGGSMQVVTNEVVSRILLSFGYAEPAITALMLMLLREGDFMVDVGTHFAYEALLGCLLVGPQGSVVGFEPNPDVFAFASQNLRAHPQARMEQMAVADLEGVARFERRPITQSAFGGISANGESATFEVRVSRLDTVLAERTRPVNFIKCDAEGHEMSVLRGATEILAKDRPVIVLEAEMPTAEGMASERAHELAEYLGRSNYKACNFDFDGQLRFGDLDAFPVYHANIAFLPTERTDLFDFLSALKRSGQAV